MNTTSPLVSIIIPTYNAEKYIEEAVKSAVSQTYKNVEVLVIDDGSSDNTRSVLQPYINSGKIKYIFQKNKGRSSARNKGLEMSSGEYVAFLDADDVYLPLKIDTQISLFRHNPDAGLVYGEVRHFQGEDRGKLYDFPGKKPSGMVFPQLKRGNFINMNSPLVKRSAIHNTLFDENISFAEDWDFWLELSQKCKFFYHKDLVALCRIGNIQHARDFVREHENTLYVLGKHNISWIFGFHAKLFLARILKLLPSSMINFIFRVRHKFFKYKHV